MKTVGSPGCGRVVIGLGVERVVTGCRLELHFSLGKVVEYPLAYVLGLDHYLGEYRV